MAICESIALLCEKGFDIILITNQSMIGRKMATKETLEAIFAKMHQGIQKAGGRIKDVFYCPHLPNAGCDCRKPEPGLIFSAQKKYNIDVAKLPPKVKTGRCRACGHVMPLKPTPPDEQTKHTKTSESKGSLTRTF